MLLQLINGSEQGHGSIVDGEVEILDLFDEPVREAAAESQSAMPGTRLSKTRSGKLNAKQQAGDRAKSQS